MRVSIIATVSALASVALAQDARAPTPNFDAIRMPTENEKVPAGSTYNILWDYSPGNPLWAGTITLSLLGGDDSKTLSVVNTIASGVDQTKGQLAWAVDKSLGSKATYGIMITLDSNTNIFQYGFPFQIAQATVESSSSSSSASVLMPSTSTTSYNSFTSASPTSAAFTSANSTSATSTLAITTIVGPASNTSSLPTMVTPPVQAGNLSTTAQPSVFTTTASTTSASSDHRPSQTPTTTINPSPENGATSVAAGSLAVFAGLAMAMFAL